MTRPSTYYPWATDDDTYNITVNGITHTVPYKAKPIPSDPVHDFTTNGAMKGISVPAQYFNWQFSGSYYWFLHLDQRYGIGDIYTTNTSKTPDGLSETLGGGWEYIGSAAKTYGTIYYWKKIY